MSRVARFGRTRYRATSAVWRTGPPKVEAKSFRSSARLPTTTRARVKMALRVGVEKVENRTAMAVTTMSLRKVRATGSSSSQVRRASIGEARSSRPTAMMATLTASVRPRPRNFPTMKSRRRIGFVMMV
jgi:hypothetical protein